VTRVLDVVFAVALVASTSAYAAYATERPYAAELSRQYANGDLPKLHAVLVWEDGHVALERYFAGSDERRGENLGERRFEAGSLHDVRSVSKSIVGLLASIALAEGTIRGLDAPVVDFFPEYSDLATIERRAITFRHLLSMTSGLHWDERTFPYTDARNSETAMNLAADRYRFILSQPLDTAPGSTFRYSGDVSSTVVETVMRAISP
jgi:CubicO group peptidase (beta-lactamase class C family)